MVTSVFWRVLALSSTPYGWALSGAVVFLASGLYSLLANSL